MKVKNSFLLILTALIWGVAFVAQQEGGDAAGPYTFNGIRSFLGGIFLILYLFTRKNLRKSEKSSSRTEERRVLFCGGTLCGLLLFAASTVQQLGLYLGSGVGKAGFLTACYILIVPLLGLFIGKKCGINVWIGVALTLLGLYLLCVKGSFVLELCDLLLLACAFLFSIHILVIDRFSPLVDGVKMSCIQFFVCGFLSIPFMIFGDIQSAGSIQNWLAPLATLQAWIPILYGGILSCGVAYTLQIVGQNGMNPTIASLLMSLESVFSVLAGFLILGEAMSSRELLGCCLIFVAIILAQIPGKAFCFKWRGVHIPRSIRRSN